MKPALPISWPDKGSPGASCGHEGEGAGFPVRRQVFQKWIRAGGESLPPGRHSHCRRTPICGETPRLCQNVSRRSRSACQVEPKRSAASRQLGVTTLVPNVFAACRMLKARIDSAASAFTALSPLVRNLPPPDIRFMVPNGCSTVHRLIVIKLGLAWIRASMRSRAP